METDLEQTMGIESSITDADKSFVETWENITLSWNTIIRLDRRGDIVEEVIRTPKKFYVTTEERLLLEDRVIDPVHNPFRNGDFRPIVVPNSVTVESNPNALSEDEMISILVSSQLAFEEWMKVIDSPATLQRMLDAANETDADIPLKRYNAVKARLEQVQVQEGSPQKDLETYEALGPKPGSGGARRKSVSTSS